VPAGGNAFVIETPDCSGSLIGWNLYQCTFLPDDAGVQTGRIFCSCIIYVEINPVFLTLLAVL
jgi:hypothetical protein